MSNENGVNTDIQNLIFKFLANSTSEREGEILLHWIRQSSSNREEFIKYKIIWLSTAQFNQTKHTQDALAKFNEKIDQIPAKRVHLFPIIRIAASLLIMFFIGATATYISVYKPTSKGSASTPIFIYAPKGSRAMTVLPDGTQVWLNAGSNLSYCTSSYGNKKRQVTLIGEAFFKVISNAEIPFVVNAKSLLIKALGTEFDVKAYPEETIVETTLIKGIVDIESEDQNKRSFKIKLKPKQKATIYAGKATIDTAVFSNPSKTEIENLSHIKLVSLPLNIPTQPIVDNFERTDLITSWKDDQWIFEGEEIGHLAVLLERRYNVLIDIKSDELRYYKFTGTFKNETIEQVLQVLKLTAPLQYTIGQGKVELTIDRALKIKYKKYMNE